MPCRLVLCRHTETDHNRKRIYSGQLDVPLNATGRAQARSLAITVGRLDGVCAVLSSDLTRTSTLGMAISTEAGVRLKLIRELREVSIGTLEGLRREEFPQRYRGDQFRTSNPNFDFTTVRGEKASDVITRYMYALRQAGRYFELCGARVARVVIVGHGTALRLVFKHHLGLIDELHEQGEYQEVPWPL